MDKTVHILIIQSVFFHNFPDAAHHGLGLVLQRRRKLVDHQFAGRFVYGADVGIGAAHVNTDSYFFHGSILLSCCIVFPS